MSDEGRRKVREKGKGKKGRRGRYRTDLEEDGNSTTGDGEEEEKCKNTRRIKKM